ncbi:hypothetical protein YC2023_015429 [Brassica napus]
MFNERNIYGVDVVPVLLGLKSIRSCVILSAAPDKPDLTEKKSSLATTNSTMPCLDAPLVKREASTEVCRDLNYIRQQQVNQALLRNLTLPMIGPS